MNNHSISNLKLIRAAIIAGGILAVVAIIVWTARNVEAPYEPRPQLVEASPVVPARNLHPKGGTSQYEADTADDTAPAQLAKKIAERVCEIYTADPCGCIPYDAITCRKVRSAIAQAVAPALEKNSDALRQCVSELRAAADVLDEVRTDESEATIASIGKVIKAVIPIASEKETT